MLKKLPSSARALWERVYKEMRKKYPEAKSAKIAWGAVKKAYVKKGDKWVKKEKVSKKSYAVEKIVSEKGLDGNTYIEGHILHFAPDEDKMIYTPEFAVDILPDLHFGKLFHFDDSEGVLKITEKKIDEEGIWARVVVVKDHPYHDKALKFVNDNPKELAFSVEEATPILDGMRMVERDGVYYREHFKGRGLGFGLTNIPKNPKAKAKAL